MHKSVIDFDDYYRALFWWTKMLLQEKLSSPVDMSDFGHFFLSERWEVSAGRIKARIFILL